MRELFVATSNRHKIAEIQDILREIGITVRSVDECGGMPEVEENADSFEGNSALKAMAAVRQLGVAVLADDSGLAVDALGGAPGIYSSRYSGDEGNHPKNIALLLKNLQGVTDRRARFVCVISVATPEDGLLGSIRGEVPGVIAEEPSGNGGFGYDPVFIPDGYTESFGVLPPEVKNSLSHRARALRNAVQAGLFDKFNNK